MTPQKSSIANGVKVIIEISAHHCHLSQKDLDIIYGKNYQLTPIKSLSQKGQFASQETVTIRVGQGEIKDVRILGPERKNTQVEISRTEAHQLKVNPPIIECTSPQKPNGCLLAEIIGPKGKVKKCALIVAHRHLHLDSLTAKKLKLKNRQLISVKTPGKRSITFHNVLVRVHPTFQFRLHLDTDEANAAGLNGGEMAEIIL